MNRDELQTLRQLLDCSLDSELTLDQVAELDALLLRSGEARRYYLEEIALIVGLQRGPPRDVRLLLTAPEMSDSGSKRLFSLAILSVAVILVLACSAWIAWSSRSHPVQQAEGDRFLATIIKAEHLQFGDGTTPVDNKLAAGRYRVDQGSVSLNFQNGVGLDVEALTVFEIGQPPSLFLRSGHARVRVPASATEFQFQVPEINIKILGGEVGVYVGEDRYTEFYVFSGYVDLHPRGGQREIAGEGAAISFHDGRRQELLLGYDPAFATRESIGFKSRDESASIPPTAR